MANVLLKIEDIILSFFSFYKCKCLKSKTKSIFFKWHDFISVSWSQLKISPLAASSVMSGLFHILLRVFFLVIRNKSSCLQVSTSYRAVSKITVFGVWPVFFMEAQFWISWSLVTIGGIFHIGIHTGFVLLTTIVGKSVSHWVFLSGKVSTPAAEKRQKHFNLNYLQSLQFSVLRNEFFPTLTLFPISSNLHF